MVLEYEGVEFTILEDLRNDITIFSFYQREPYDIEEELFEIELRHVYGVQYSEKELLDIIKTFNI